MLKVARTVDTQEVIGFWDDPLDQFEAEGFTNTAGEPVECEILRLEHITLEDFSADLQAATEASPDVETAALTPEGTIGTETRATVFFGDDKKVKVKAPRPRPVKGVEGIKLALERKTKGLDEGTGEPKKGAQAQAGGGELDAASLIMIIDKVEKEEIKA